MIPGPYAVEARSGRFVDLAKPDPATILLEDVAHGLAHTCRFGGHTRAFLSVAEHAVTVAGRLIATGHNARTALAGLHHDDAEAFIGDWPTPLKRLVGDDYRRLEVRVSRACWLALGNVAPWWDTSPIADAVRAADRWALVHEAAALLPSQGAGWIDPDEREPGFSPLCLTPGKAAAHFLDAHRELSARAAAEVAA